ncbi:hypothetical protein J8273_5308 [Carpediemonas membranifera]|uniref:Uncharacterized protein n=1 Tax=Carpediemonas membranifera TaxID=201153 RepID=A0A8J6DYJ0_9EUKA|nr:hypothetical protein J8273_5308 [Carpediemonas membranifera]|eukprot:KAG9392319.1 hypothetical protein J8273_5308 [Carpediemonas membranifera]
MARREEFYTQFHRILLLARGITQDEPGNIPRLLSSVQNLPDLPDVEVEALRNSNHSKDEFLEKLKALSEECNHVEELSETNFAARDALCKAIETLEKPPVTIDIPLADGEDLPDTIYTLHQRTIWAIMRCRQSKRAQAWTDPAWFLCKKFFFVRCDAKQAEAVTCTHKLSHTLYQGKLLVSKGTGDETIPSGLEPVHHMSADKTTTAVVTSGGVFFWTWHFDISQIKQGSVETRPLPLPPCKPHKWHTSVSGVFVVGRGLIVLETTDSRHILFHQSAVAVTWLPLNLGPIGKIWNYAVRDQDIIFVGKYGCAVGSISLPLADQMESSEIKFNFIDTSFDDAISIGVNGLLLLRDGEVYIVTPKPEYWPLGSGVIQLHIGTARQLALPEGTTRLLCSGSAVIASTPSGSYVVGNSMLKRFGFTFPTGWLSSWRQVEPCGSVVQRVWGWVSLLMETRDGQLMSQGATVDPRRVRAFGNPWICWDL